MYPSDLVNIYKARQTRKYYWQSSEQVLTTLKLYVNDSGISRHDEHNAKEMVGVFKFGHVLIFCHSKESHLSKAVASHHDSSS